MTSKSDPPPPINPNQSSDPLSDSQYPRVDPILNYNLAPSHYETTTMPSHPQYHPYMSATSTSSSSSFTDKNTMDSVKNAIGKWRKKAADATSKAQDLASNTWQHLKTSPSVTDAAVARIAHQTKVLTEGGYENIFRQSFGTLPEAQERLRNWYACYLSTSVGPVMGTLYLSTTKLAFCSDDPLSYNDGETTQWSYYKVVIPLHRVKAVNPSTSKVNSGEKYIQITSIDNHEFWFMGFVSYDNAVNILQDTIQVHNRVVL